MSKIEQTYQRITRYLKGVLSNRERHDLEREMTHDVFDEEAFEGLSQLSAGELESDMDILFGRLEDRLATKKTRKLMPMMRIAAAMLVLAGLGSVLFLVFRTPSHDLITQETRREKQVQPAETAAPEAPAPSVPQQAETLKKEKSASSAMMKQDEHPAIAEKKTGADMEVEPIEMLTEEAVAMDLESHAPAVSRQKAAQPLPQAAKTEQTKGNTITGRVLGINGEALPGVTIMEKGTSRGAVTDQNGLFSMQVDDTGAQLAISYIGYKTLEISSNEAAGNDIIMSEDLVALNEVVVVGYGTQKRSSVTGAVSTVEAKDISDAGEPAPYNYIKPVPPGGSLKAFKNWVESQVNHSLFLSFQGKHRIIVNLTLNTNGSISDIRIRENIPGPMAAEYKRVIAQSQLWQPALENTVPVESEIIIRFVVEVE